MSQYKNMICVKPTLIPDVLYNPGMGFATFQRFNGDKMNEGLKWTEGYPIEYQEFTGSLETPGHPFTTVAYHRIYWRFLEPEEGNYRWDILDKALETARERKQTLMLRVAPYSSVLENKSEVDVPDWYRKAVGTEKNIISPRWVVDANNPYYSQCFARFIRALGKRYDGHPGMESVDMALVGYWGEGADSHLLKPEYMRELVDAYADGFTNTPLKAMLTDPITNKYILSRTNAGFRADCLGDMAPKEWGYKTHDELWCHMTDKYPQQINSFGVSEAWRKGPISFEPCWVMGHWYRMGWDIDYIIGQSLKWHISTFSTKSSAVPAEWEPHVQRWLTKMGYRYAPRYLMFPSKIKPGRAMQLASWWENLGVAPCYRKYPLAVRLAGEKGSFIIKTTADIREWMPGDIWFDSDLPVPPDLPPGTYKMQMAMLELTGETPAIHWAVEGREADGWYTMGEVESQFEEEPQRLPYDFYYE
jgi:hypothetical protein